MLHFLDTHGVLTSVKEILPIWKMVVQVNRDIYVGASVLI